MHTRADSSLAGMRGSTNSVPTAPTRVGNVHAKPPRKSRFDGIPALGLHWPLPAAIIAIPVEYGGMMGVLDVVATVLNDARAPLHYNEITKRVLASGAWKTDGKTPNATINAQLSTDIAK